ncbi:kinesin-like protein KIN-6 isoform X6 [Cannabis sativa]|uniref:kinesin-like protein KIN-6 isoform X6 n=1 Tax=Cannabis sativa TaxID=3483 RepID=UPI0029C9F632|nr:kinesin-like protein KIN-6 isoform X6 [Cannabis sativa]
METKSPLTCPYSVTIRRNPSRKARPATTDTKPPQVPPHSSSSTAQEIPSFPTEEILSMEVSENPKPKFVDSISENLRVFLRVRPILSSTSSDKDHFPKSRAKNAWPQNPAKKTSARDATTNKKKSSEVCIKVNDCHSVTLTPPMNLQEAKRVKSEVYEGFSHVFAPDSSQEEVYEKMVSPLVEDFLKGKSGMLATLGPSGSGKTHTVFGSVRDPGILPRTLRQIFKPPLETDSELRSRAFSISIFEIQSERKGEKLFDLSPGGGGADLTMQKSSIKGLQEVTVTDARQAEALVAHAIVNRLTATTNTNSQSSRSQCIINIRSVGSEFEGQDEHQANSAVLSIVDLAGAEREKKTGNQGSRLLESNFINNTSMVFGSCLRSLLEHQRNPKRPLQKHFQNSLLTRYLRDYMEGKKRMALILTVKSGEEDYLDTTYLLRQASPLMRIRFDNVEEPPNVPSNKRQFQALSKNKKPKRMKFSGADTCGIEEGKTDEDDQHTTGEGCGKEDTKIFISEISDRAPLVSSSVDLERNCEIWQNFAKAFWNTLKQYREKLKVAENEIQHLNENLKVEKARYVVLEKKLGGAESCSNSSLQKSVEIALVETGTNVNHSGKLNRPDICDFDKDPVTPSRVKIDISTQDPITSSQVKIDISTQDPVTSTQDQNFSQLKIDISTQDPITSSQVKIDISTQDPVPSSQTNTACDSLSFRVASSGKSSDKFDSNTDQDQNFSQLQESLAQSTSLKEDLANTKDCKDVSVLNNERRSADTSSKPGKPRRRLLPASSVLLKDFSTLEIDEKSEKRKENRGGKKFYAEERNRTQGSISLLRLLNNNIGV